MQFVVTSAEVRDITVTWRGSRGGCSASVTTRMAGPYPITNRQFSTGSGSSTVSGTFESQFTAQGSYSMSSSACGGVSEGGNWSANR